MKTTGQILKKTRESQNITINEISRLTKIDPEYIISLEKDDYQNLPSATFIKGFIRNIAKALNKNPDELIAIFRRDYHPQNSKNQLEPKPLKPKKSSHSWSRLSLIAVAVVVFFSYFAFQLRAFLIPPKLEIVQPQKETVLISPITIEGVTSPDAIIQINQEKIIKPSSSGHFLTNLSLPLGSREIKISTTNRFSRTTTIFLPVTIISQ